MRLGSLRYHYLAWKHQRTHWRPFLKAIGAWLKRWEQKSLSLILVGPSAGYSLPEEFIYRYDRIIVIEKDIIGRYLFNKKFSQARPIFYSEDLAESLPRVLKKYPEADLVFCNVLGQVFIDWHKQGWSTQKFSDWKTLLCGQIQDRHWCSYHDLYSMAGKIEFIRDQSQFSLPISVDEIIKTFATKHKMKTIEITDHLTHDLFLKGKRIVQHWKLTPQRHFFIELIRGDDIFLNQPHRPSLLEKLMASEHHT